MDECKPLPGALSCTAPPNALQSCTTCQKLGPRRYSSPHHRRVIGQNIKPRLLIYMASCGTWRAKWGQPGAKLGLSGVSLGSIWDQPGVNLGSIWDQPEVNLGSTWGQPGINLGSTWDKSGINLESTRAARSQPWVNLG